MYCRPCGRMLDHHFQFVYVSIAAIKAWSHVSPYHCCKGRSHISPTSLLQGTVSYQPHIIAARDGLMSTHSIAGMGGLMSAHSIAKCVLLFTITLSSSLPHSYVHTSQYHVTPYVNHYHNYITAFTPCQCHPPHSNHLAPLHHTSSPHVITTWITHCVLLFVHWNWM